MTALQGRLRPDPPIPDLPGWTVTMEDGRWVAETRRPYSHYQWLAGAQDQATAQSPTELRILCDSYDALAEALSRAERAH